MPDLIAILTDIRPDENFSGVDDFFAKGVLDSVDLTTLVAALEESCAIFIDVDEIVPENFRNLEAIRALLTRHGVAN